MIALSKKFYLSIIIACLVNFNVYPQTIIQDVINQVNIDSLTYFVKQLSGDIPAIVNGQPYTIISRTKNYEGNDKAGLFIKWKFESYGLQSSLQTFSATGNNVIGMKTGTQYPNKKYIICAHYDDVPYLDLPAPGADDNASGTAAVIEAARIFSQYSFPYTLIFAAWDEEEFGLVGSTYYANQASTAGDSILGVINMDMIGYDSNNDFVCEVHTRPIANSLTISDKMIEINQNFNIGLTSVLKNPGIGFSDHYSFWEKNYSAIFLIEDRTNDFNAYYHTSNDRIQYFNIPFYEKMSKLSIATLAWFVFDSALPVELINFTANSSGGDIIINWSTATETNNKGFEIQKSVRSSQSAVSNWEAIGFVNGRGTTTEKQNYSFTDNDVSAGKYFYRLKQIDFDGTFEYSNEIEVVLTQPTEFALYQNYPNPFNPSTKISWQSPVSSWQTLKVFDVLGNEIATLVDEYKPSGVYEVEFSAKGGSAYGGNAVGLASGIYFYQLRVGDFVTQKKMILTK